jgi:hypothetical protein
MTFLAQKYMKKYRSGLTHSADELNHGQPASGNLWTVRNQLLIRILDTYPPLSKLSPQPVVKYARTVPRL